jgi:hypothetical protein
MELLRDQALLDANFGPFRDSANLDTRYVHCLPRMYHMVRNHFGRTQWNSLVMSVMWNIVLVRLEKVLVSVQDRCTVCTKRTIVFEIVLNTPMELLGDVSHVESRFSPFGDGVSVGAR